MRLVIVAVDDELSEEEAEVLFGEEAQRTSVLGAEYEEEVLDAADRAVLAYEERKR